MDILDYGAPAVLVLVLYTIVDKVVVPLVRRAVQNGKPDPTSVALDVEKLKVLVKRNERDIQTIQKTNERIRTTIEGSRSILERIDGKLR